MTIEEVINKAKYLLEAQKERLIEDIESTDLRPSEKVYMDFLDMVLEKVLDMRVDDLSTSEEQQVKYILQDLGVKVHD